MKKFIAFVLALLMVLTLAACGSDNTTAPDTDSSIETQQTSSQDEQTPPTDEQANSSEEDSAYALCGLTIDDIKTTVGTSTGDALEMPTQVVVPVFCADASFASFESWVNALADNCRKASTDGKLYEDEFSWNVVEALDLDSSAINFVQFVYKTTGHVVYVTAAESGSVENAFSCNIQVY